MPDNAIQRSFPEAGLEGGCACRNVRYRLRAQPMIVHCCHCRWCQRESGSAFAMNAVVETARVEITCGAVDMVDTPSQSGKGQQIARCPACKVALWSHYAGGGPNISFLRVGTTDDPDLLPPDVHIYTASRQPWVILPENVPAMAEYYSPPAVWTPENMARYRAAKAGK